MSGKRPCTNLSIFGPAYPIAPFGLCTTGFVAGSAHNSVPPNPSPHVPNRIALTTANLDCHRPAHLKPVRNSLTLSPLLPPPSRPPQQARRPRHLRRLSYPCRPRHRLARESKITLSCPLLLLLFALQSISGPVALAVARPTLGRGSSLFALLWGSDSARVSVSSRLRSLG
jgi:hypothetical protein